jgi:two-component system sensor histidine kinase AlgZ
MPEAARRRWFPDFCRLPRIAAVLAIAELVVVVVALAPTRAKHWNANEFGAASAFALWLGLTIAILYCKLGPAIERLPRTPGFVAALALPLVVGALGAFAIQQIDLGLGLHLTLPEAERGRFMLGIGALATLISGLSLRYFYVAEQWRARLQAQAKAEVDALQARIRPHFLFNSMNTIASLVRSDPPTAERAVEDLSELFRAALGAQGESTLAEEIHLAQRYLAIESLRLGERLQVRWDVAAEAPMSLRLPRLVLQPLLENAVVHGIALLPRGGCIGIAIAPVDGRRLRIEIANPAPPVGSHAATVAGQGGNRHAQESIEQRLAYHFGTGVVLERTLSDGEYRCRIELPLP